MLAQKSNTFWWKCAWHSYKSWQRFKRFWENLLDTLILAWYSVQWNGVGRYIAWSSNSNNMLFLKSRLNWLVSHDESQDFQQKSLAMFKRATEDSFFALDAKYNLALQFCQVKEVIFWIPLLSIPSAIIYRLVVWFCCRGGQRTSTIPAHWSTIIQLTCSDSFFAWEWWWRSNGHSSRLEAVYPFSFDKVKVRSWLQSRTRCDLEKCTNTVQTRSG